MLTQGRIKSEHFCNVLEKLTQKHARLAILCDNASYHVSAESRSCAERLNIKMIQNVPYRPELAPIEKVFLHHKENYRRRRLQAITDGLIWRE